MKTVTALLLALCFALPARADIDDYAGCMRIYLSTNGFLDWMRQRQEDIPDARIAAFKTDLGLFVELGVKRYGEPAVAKIVNAQTPEFANEITEVFKENGAQDTFARLATMLVPCSPPQGQLKLFYPG